MMILCNTPAALGLPVGAEATARGGALHASMRRPQLAGEKAHGVGLHRVHREGHQLGAMAGAAFEGPLFEAALARRDPRQSHPVLASRAHRPLDDVTQENTHHLPMQNKTTTPREGLEVGRSARNQVILTFCRS